MVAKKSESETPPPCACERGEPCRAGDWRVSHAADRRGETHDVYTLDLGACVRLGVLSRSFRALSDAALRDAVNTSSVGATVARRRRGVEDRVKRFCASIARAEAEIAQLRAAAGEALAALDREGGGASPARLHNLGLHAERAAKRLESALPALERRLAQARKSLKRAEVELARVPSSMTAVEVECQRLRRERDALVTKLMRPSQGRHQQTYDLLRGNVDESGGWRRRREDDAKHADEREGDAAAAGARCWLESPGGDYLRALPRDVSTDWADAFAAAHEECSEARARGASVDEIRAAVA